MDKNMTLKTRIAEVRALDALPIPCQRDNHDEFFDIINELTDKLDIARKALENILECAHGIMPYKDRELLKETVIALDDARWTRLYAILVESEQALKLTDIGEL